MGKKKTIAIKATSGTGPFDVMKSLFSVKNVVFLYTPESLRQMFFIINRTLAIKYPMQANAFNLPKIDVVGAIYSWNLFLFNGRGPQSWVYTKGGKKAAEERNAKSKISSETIHEYARIYCVKVSDIEAAMEMFPKETESELLEFDSTVVHPSEK
ncbi:hypothetical protein EOM86_14265 [Candidatus Nomurabacteria bacterium]|nr:hypothetical protein [Candidatus Nomurabacteria bacterium]